MEEDIPGIVTRSRRRPSVDSTADAKEEDNRSAAGTPTKRGKPVKRLSVKPDLEDVIESVISTPTKHKNPMSKEDEIIPASPARFTRARKSLSIPTTADSPCRNLRNRTTSSTSPEGLKILEKKLPASNGIADLESETSLQAKGLINKISDGLLTRSTVDSPKPRRNKRLSAGGSDDVPVEITSTRRSRRLSIDLKAIEEDPMKEEQCQVESSTPGPTTRRGKRRTMAPAQPSVPEETENEEPKGSPSPKIEETKCTSSNEINTPSENIIVSPRKTSENNAENLKSPVSAAPEKVDTPVLETSTKSNRSFNRSSEKIGNTSVELNVSGKMNKSLENSLKQSSNVSLEVDAKIRKSTTPNRLSNVPLVMNESQNQDQSLKNNSSKVIEIIELYPKKKESLNRSSNKLANMSMDLIRSIMNTSSNKSLNNTQTESSNNDPEISSSKINNLCGESLSLSKKEKDSRHNVSSNKTFSGVESITISSPKNTRANKSMSALGNNVPKSSEKSILRSKICFSAIESKSNQVDDIALKLDFSADDSDEIEGAAQERKNISINKSLSDKSLKRKSLNNQNISEKVTDTPLNTSNKISPRRRSAKDFFVEELNCSKSPNDKDDSQNLLSKTHGRLLKENTENLTTSTPILLKKGQDSILITGIPNMVSSQLDKENSVLSPNEKIQKSVQNKSPAFQKVLDGSDNESESEASVKAEDYLALTVDAGMDYESGDSMDQDEAKEMDDNEIVEKGITLDSDSSDVEDDSYEIDSFVCDSDEEDNKLLSGTEDDLDSDVDELTQSKISKAKFNKKEAEKNKNVSKEIYNSRHGLDGSANTSNSKSFKRIRNMSDMSNSPLNNITEQEISLKALNQTADKSTSKDPLSVTYLQNESSSNKKTPPKDDNDENSVSSMNDDDIENIANMFENELSGLQKTSIVKAEESSDSDEDKVVNMSHKNNSIENITTEKTCDKNETEKMNTSQLRILNKSTETSNIKINITEEISESVGRDIDRSILNKSKLNKSLNVLKSGECSPHLSPKSKSFTSNIAPKASPLLARDDLLSTVTDANGSKTSPAQLHSKNKLDQSTKASTDEPKGNKEKYSVTDKKINETQAMTIAGLLNSLPDAVRSQFTANASNNAMVPNIKVTSTTDFKVEKTKSNRKRKVVEDISIIEDPSNPTWTSTAGEFRVAKKFKENPSRPFSTSNSGCTTCFNVVSLKKHSKQILKVDNQLALSTKNFKQDMLFGSRVRRENGSHALTNIEKKLQAKNKYSVRQYN